MTESDRVLFFAGDSLADDGQAVPDPAGLLREPQPELSQRSSILESKTFSEEEGTSPLIDDDIAPLVTLIRPPVEGVEVFYSNISLHLLCLTCLNRQIWYYHS